MLVQASTKAENKRKIFFFYFLVQCGSQKFQTKTVCFELENLEVAAERF